MYFVSLRGSRLWINDVSVYIWSKQERSFRKPFSSSHSGPFSSRKSVRLFLIYTERLKKRPQIQLLTFLQSVEILFPIFLLWTFLSSNCGQSLYWPFSYSLLKRSYTYMLNINIKTPNFSLTSDAKVELNLLDAWVTVRAITRSQPQPAVSWTVVNAVWR